MIPFQSPEPRILPSFLPFSPRLQRIILPTLQSASFRSSRTLPCRSRPHHLYHARQSSTMHSPASRRLRPDSAQRKSMTSLHPANTTLCYVEKIAIHLSVLAVVRGMGNVSTPRVYYGLLDGAVLIAISNFSPQTTILFVTGQQLTILNWSQENCLLSSRNYYLLYYYPISFILTVIQSHLFLEVIYVLLFWYNGINFGLIFMYSIVVFACILFSSVVDFACLLFSVSNALADFL